MTLSELFVDLPATVQARLEYCLENSVIPVNATREQVYRKIEFIVSDIELEFPDMTVRERDALGAIPDAFIETLF